MEIINGVNNPVIGTIAISDGTLVSLTVTSLLRYNGNGQFTCGVKDAGIFFGTMDVYWSTTNNRFQAKEYIPTRYRDEEGVEKGL